MYIYIEYYIYIYIFFKDIVTTARYICVTIVPRMNPKKCVDDCVFLNMA